MSEIKAGIICKTKFCEASSKAFADYISYIDRDEAVRKDNLDKYNLFQDYLDYVGDTRKLGGLFTADRDSLSPDDKKALKTAFSTAQDNESNLWQTVLSFDNRYLEEQGLFDSKTDALNAPRLMNATRKAVAAMLKKENLENAVWAASFHYNTDNIHVHIAITEPHPMREKNLYRQYEKTEDGKIKRIMNPATGRYEKIPLKDATGNDVYEWKYKGVFKDSTLNGKGGIKSILRAEIENSKESSMEITALLRSIVSDKKERKLMEQDDFNRELKAIYDELKSLQANKVYRNMWSYNRSALNHLKPQLDALTDLFVAKYHAEDFKKLTETLMERQTGFGKSYGGENEYLKQILKKEFYPRMGNAILKELREYDTYLQNTFDVVKNAEKMIAGGRKKEVMELLTKEAERGNSYAQNRLGLLYYFGRGVEKDETKAREYFTKAASSGDAFAAKLLESMDRNALNRARARRLYENQNSIRYDFAKAAAALRRSMEKTYENYTAMTEFEKLQREIEQRGSEINQPEL